jgi:hypothetical protein
MHVEGLKTKTQALHDEEKLAKIHKVPKKYRKLVRNAIEAVFKKEPPCQ